MNNIGNGFFIRKQFKDGKNDIRNNGHLYIIISNYNQKILSIKTQTFKGEKIKGYHLDKPLLNSTLIDTENPRGLSLIRAVDVYDITDDLKNKISSKKQIKIDHKTLIKIYCCLISQEMNQSVIDKVKIENLDYLTKEHKKNYFENIIKIFQEKLTD